jgi:hypothetical protein
MKLSKNLLIPVIPKTHDIIKTKFSAFCNFFIEERVIESLKVSPIHKFAGDNWCLALAQNHRGIEILMQVTPKSSFQVFSLLIPMGKFPARPSNKSRYLLWPCKIATSLFDPDFIFLPFHGPALTSAINSQSSDCEKIIVPLAHKQQILRSHGEQILEMYSMILCSIFIVLYISNICSP